MTAEINRNTKPETPPANALRVTGWRGLPSNKALTRFRVTDTDGNTWELTLSKNKRRVVEGLMKQPLYCASPCRISDIVHILKNNCGIAIDMELYSNDREKFGFYFLSSRVELVAECEVPA